MARAAQQQQQVQQPEQDQQQQPQVDQQQADNNNLDPVEVDLESGTVVGDDQQQQQQQAQPQGDDADDGDDGQHQQQPTRQRRPRSQQRIQALNQRASDAEATANRLAAELAEERRQAEEARRRAHETDSKRLIDHEARWQAEERLAKRDLADAIAAQDPEKQAEANGRLAKAAAALGDIEAVKASQPKPGEQQQQQQTQQQQPQHVPEPQFKQHAETVRSWITDPSNSWFSAVKLDNNGHPVVQRDNSGRPLVRNGQYVFVPNPDFDDEMHDTAILLAKRAVRKGLNESQQEYWDFIEQGLDEEYGDGQQQQQQPQQRRQPPQMQQQRQPVAGANRNALPGQQSQQRSETRMRLSGEQAAFVRQMVDQGVPGYKYPRGHKMQGQKMTYQDAYVKYAREAQKTGDQGQGGR